MSFKHQFSFCLPVLIASSRFLCDGHKLKHGHGERRFNMCNRNHRLQPQVLNGSKNIMEDQRICLYSIFLAGNSETKQIFAIITRQTKHHFRLKNHICLLIYFAKFQFVMNYTTLKP